MREKSKRRASGLTTDYQTSRAEYKCFIRTANIYKGTEHAYALMLCYVLKLHTTVC